MIRFLERIFGSPDPNRVGKCRFWIDYEPLGEEILKIKAPALQYTLPLTKKVQTEEELRDAANKWLAEKGLQLRDERYIRHSIRWGSNITGTLYRAAPKAGEK